MVTEVDVNLADNTAGLITPAIVRSTLIDIIESYFDFGGSSSVACNTSNWVSQLASLADSVVCTQPGLSDLSNYQQNEVSNVDLALVPAYTFKGNATGSLATPQDFTIPGVTLKTTPVNADLLLIADSAASNATKHITVGSLPNVAGSVSSLNGLTGVLTIKSGNFVCAVTALTPNVTVSCESISPVMASTGTTALNTGATSYFWGADGVSTTESVAEVSFPMGGTFKNMYVSLVGAPGAGKQYAFTLDVNGSPTLLTCNVSGAAVTLCNSTATATIVTGQSVDISAVPTGTPAAQQVAVMFTFQTP